jgi:hypothetical protein
VENLWSQFDGVMAKDPEAEAAEGDGGDEMEVEHRGDNEEGDVTVTQ